MSEPRATTAPCHSAPLLPLLSLCWFSLEEERVMQQSSVSISLSFENQGIDPVGDDAQVTEYLHKQSRTCNQRDKGAAKVRSDRDNKVNIFGIFVV